MLTLNKNSDFQTDLEDRSKALLDLTPTTFELPKLPFPLAGTGQLLSCIDKKVAKETSDIRRHCWRQVSGTSALKQRQAVPRSLNKEGSAQSFGFTRLVLIATNRSARARKACNGHRLCPEAQAVDGTESSRHFVPIIHYLSQSGPLAVVAAPFQQPNEASRQNAGLAFWLLFCQEKSNRLGYWPSKNNNSQQGKSKVAAPSGAGAIFGLIQKSRDLVLYLKNARMCLGLRGLSCA